MAGLEDLVTGSNAKSAKSRTSSFIPTRLIRAQRLRLLGELRSKRARAEAYEKPRRHQRLRVLAPAALAERRAARRSLFGKNQAYSRWEERLVWKVRRLSRLILFPRPDLRRLERLGNFAVLSLVATKSALRMFLDRSKLNTRRLPREERNHYYFNRRWLRKQVPEEERHNIILGALIERISRDTVLITRNDQAEMDGETANPLKTRERGLLKREQRQCLETFCELLWLNKHEVQAGVLNQMRKALNAGKKSK